MKKYIVNLECEITSSRQDIIEMYDGVIPTDKELFKMHRQYLDEMIDKIKETTGITMKAKSFTESMK